MPRFVNGDEPNSSQDGMGQKKKLNRPLTLFESTSPPMRSLAIVALVAALLVLANAQNLRPFPAKVRPPPPVPVFWITPHPLHLPLTHPCSLLALLPFSLGPYSQ